MRPASRPLRVLIDYAISDTITNATNEISALLLRPPRARALYVLAHGAGAGMDHPFMEAMAQRLADRGIATFRYRFPYMESGRKRPDHARVLQATVHAAIDAAGRAAPRLPIVAGGKSMGGRMTSLLMAGAPHAAVRGLAFLGFPLHAAGKPSARRGEHLAQVAVPMLFLQGTRDALADLDLLRPIIDALDDGRIDDRGARATLRLATLRVIEGGDHGFHVLVRSGRTQDEVLDELADALVAWIDEIIGR